MLDGVVGISRAERMEIVRPQGFVVSNRSRRIGQILVCSSPMSLVTGILLFAMDALIGPDVNEVMTVAEILPTTMFVVILVMSALGSWDQAAVLETAIAATTRIHKHKVFWLPIITSNGQLYYTGRFGSKKPHSLAS
jgi:hypothetical protein